MAVDLLTKLQVTYVVNGKEYQIFHDDVFAQDIDLSLNEYLDGVKRPLFQTKLIHQDPDPPIPPVVDHQYNEFGTLMLGVITGNKVKMNVGGDPAGNGQRYNCNHRFPNYIMQGYFKTGKGQAQIEMKTDGPNHGSCKSIPQCMWYEPQILINGQAQLGGEWPHPTNHSGLKTDLALKVEGGIAQQWIGYAVKAYNDEFGFRVIEQYCAKNPFDAQGKPTNVWKLVMRAVERMDGKMFPTNFDSKTIFPRKLPVDFNKGLEAEIRMHRTQANHGQPNGTDMKDAYVYELKPLIAGA